jgi:DNA-binding FadR family transcriptional regulator
VPTPRIATDHVTSVRTERSTEILARELRRLVSSADATGRMLPPERELTERFGVSRPTLREAMRVLEAEGLVVVRRGTKGGAEVLPPDVTHLGEAFGLYLQRTCTTVADLFMAREILEPAAARMAARVGNLDGLWQALASEERALAEDAREEEIGAVTTGFHDALLEASGSNTLAALGRLLDGVVERHGSRAAGAFAEVSGLAQQEALAASHQAHQWIVRAIEAGDEHTAAERAAEHLHALHASTSRLTPTTLLEMFQHNGASV